jgi:hypothetical protein
VVLVEAMPNKGKRTTGSKEVTAIGNSSNVLTEELL